MGRGLGGRKSLPWTNGKSLGIVIEQLAIPRSELTDRINAGREVPAVSSATVGKIIRGELIPTIPLGKLIADALGMTIEQVFYRANEAQVVATVTTNAAERSADPVIGELLLHARKQLVPFARKHPRGEDGIRDVSALLERLDDALMRFGYGDPARICPAVAL